MCKRQYLILLAWYTLAKNVKGIDYAYMVKSVWDQNNKSSKQVTIKYLGKASDIDIGDIHESFRHDLKIVSFVSKYNPVDVHKKAIIIKSLHDKLLHCRAKLMSTLHLACIKSLEMAFHYKISMTRFFAL
jgi:hypothetical protein